MASLPANPFINMLRGEQLLFPKQQIIRIALLV